MHTIFISNRMQYVMKVTYEGRSGPLAGVVAMIVVHGRVICG